MKTKNLQQRINGKTVMADLPSFLITLLQSTKFGESANRKKGKASLAKSIIGKGLI